MKTLNRILTLALVAVASTACDGRTVTVTPTFTRTFAFSFDSNNGTTETATLTEDDIIGELDLPADAIISSIDIERVLLTLAPGTGNDASTATLTFSYAAQGFTDDLDITLSAIDQQPVDALVATTLRAMESDVYGLATGTGPFAITVQGDISNIASTGSRLVLDADLYVRFTLTYTFCEDLGFGPFGPGADCITPDNPLVTN